MQQKVEKMKKDFYSQGKGGKEKSSHKLGLSVQK